MISPATSRRVNVLTVSTTRHSGGDAADTSAELMYVRCSNCNAWMDVKPGQVSGVTHSICPACLKKELQKLDREDRAKPGR